MCDVGYLSVSVWKKRSVDFRIFTESFLLWFWWTWCYGGEKKKRERERGRERDEREMRVRNREGIEMWKEKKEGTGGEERREGL